MMDLAASAHIVDKNPQLPQILKNFQRLQKSLSKVSQEEIGIFEREDD